jgi:hypothetical protein
MAEKQMTAGRKSRMFTTMVPKACVKNKMTGFMLQLHTRGSVNFRLVTWQ